MSSSSADTSSNAPPKPKKPKAPPLPGEEDPKSFFGDSPNPDDTSDATPGSTQSQMSASQLSIKQKKNKHSYQVRWS